MQYTSSSSPETGTGCFVYQVIVDQVQVVNDTTVGISNCNSNSSTTTTIFYRGDLVCIDTVTSQPDGRTLLHLSDNSGWLWGTSSLLKPVTVRQPQVPLVVYVDNYPDGVALLRHPTDRIDMQAGIGYPPLQKLWSDLQVSSSDNNNNNNNNSVTFYHVQGAGGWLPDKRSRDHPSAPISRTNQSCNNNKSYEIEDDEEEDYDSDDLSLLLQEGQVKFECQAYVALRTVEVRTTPDVGRQSRAGIYLHKGDIAIVNAIRQSPFPHNGNGPFLHVPHVVQSSTSSSSSSSGWLFEKKHFDRIMERIELEIGQKWNLVVQTRFGIKTIRNNCILSIGNNNRRRRASAGGGIGMNVVYPQNTSLRCSARVESPITGAYFYQVQEGEGQETNNNKNNDGGSSSSSCCWVCDRCYGDSEPTLLLPADPVVVAQVEYNNNNSAHHLTAASQTSTNTGNMNASGGEGFGGGGESSRILDAIGGGDNNMWNDDNAGWTPDFVRGVAAPIDGLEELSLDPTRNLLSFVHKPDGTEIHVNYCTRTVVTALEPSSAPPSVTRIDPYKSKIQHLFSPLPEQRLSQQQHVQPMKLCHCTTKQLAELFANPATSTAGEPFPPPSRSASSMKSPQQPSTTISSISYNTITSPPLPLRSNRREDDSGIVLGSREMVMASYDPLAQPLPATPASRGNNLAPNSTAASSIASNNSSSSPQSAVLVEASREGSMATATAANYGGANDGGSSEEVEVRRSFLECERELAVVQQRHTQLLQSVRTLDDQNARAAARLLGRMEPFSPQQHSPVMHTAESNRRASTTNTAVSATASNTVTHPAKATPFAVSSAVAEERRESHQQSAQTRVPATSETRLTTTSRPLPKWRTTTRVIKSSTMRSLRRRSFSSDDSDEDESSYNGGNNDDNKGSGDNGDMGEQMNHICGVCRDEFTSARSRSYHCLSQHGMFSCNYCTEVFDTNDELRSHRDRLDHW